MSVGATCAAIAGRLALQLGVVLGRDEPRLRRRSAAPAGTREPSAEVSSPISRSNWIAGRPSTVFSTRSHVQSKSRSTSAAASTRNVFVLNTRTASSSKSAGSAEALEDHRPAVHPHRDAAAVARPTFSTTSTVTGSPWARCQPEHQRIDRRAEVVEVRDPQRTRPPPSTNRPQPMRAADARRAGRRGRWRAMLGSPVVVAEERALGRQPQARRPGVKASTRPAVEPVAQRLADRLVGRVARHQQQRQRRPGRGSSARARPAGHRGTCGPATASTSALTTPPIRVAMPPASTTSGQLAPARSPPCPSAVELAARRRSPARAAADVARARRLEPCPCTRFARARASSVAGPGRSAARDRTRRASSSACSAGSSCSPARPAQISRQVP